MHNKIRVMEPHTITLSSTQNMQRLIQPNRNAAMAQSEAFTNYKEKLSKVINFIYLKIRKTYLMILIKIPRKNLTIY